MKLHRLGLAFLIFASVSVGARAQQSHVNQARGFNANQVYSVHDLDSVNVFNGNLVLGLPIGGTYKAGPDLSYSLKLFYNSNVWTHYEVAGGSGGVNTNYNYMTVWVWPHAAGQQGSYTYVVWRVEPFIPNDSQDPPRAASSTDTTFTEAAPNPNANGGMGWQMTLGNLFPPEGDLSMFDPQVADSIYWVYQAPDGSEHQFYPTLHEDDPHGPQDSDPATDPVTYTRDGTYLRMKVIDADTRTIEFPDGTVHTLRNLTPPQQGNPWRSPTWRVVQMADRFGNAVNISYSLTTDPSTQKVTSEHWTIDDGQRTNYVYLERFPNTPHFGPVIRWANLAGFNGQRAIYNFNYDVRTITRAWPHAPDSPYGNTDITVPFLSSVTQPDQSQYSMGPVDQAYDLTGDYSDPKYRGILRKLTLPTGARLEWEYKPETPDPPLPEGRNHGYAYPTMSTGRAYLRRNRAGVRVRRLIEGSNTYTWRYDPQLEPQTTPCSLGDPTPECAHKVFKNKVTTPQGDYTWHHFSVYPFPQDSDVGRQPADWHVAEYGLSLRKDVPKTMEDGSTVFLSAEAFNSAGVKLRETYVRYETDKLTQRNPWGSVVANDRRLVASRTVYLDDYRDGGVKHADLRHSGFDGLGHFRFSETGGNFGAADYRLDQTDYNLTSGTYHIDPATNQPAGDHSYQPFPESRAWVLGTYGAKIQKEGREVAKQQFVFDQQGRLLRKRVLWQTGIDTVPPTHARDVLVAYGYDAAGNLQTEDFYGGDKRADLPTGPLASVSLPATSEHRVTHTYEHGVLKTSQHRGANFYSHDADIDASTGLVSRSRDLSKLWTDYAYDLMGRVTEIKPATGSRTVIQYSPVTGGATGGTPSATVQHKTNNGAQVLDEERYEYDNLGRLKVEKKKMPGGAYIARRTLYNGQGWMTAQSVWNTDGAGFADQTLYEEYDPFGRAQKVTPPEGSSHVVRYEYRGVREVKRTVKAATAFAGGVSTETDVITFEGYDRQGRLGSVSEDSGSQGDDLVKTFYAYDVGGRLKEATTTGRTPPLRTNWAAAANGGRAVASSSLGGFPPSSAIDGDRTGANWTANGGWNDGTPDQFPDQLWVDFSGQKQINEVNVFTLADDYRSGEQPTLSTTFTYHGIVDFDVHYLNAANQFVLIAAVRNNDKVWRQFRFPTVTTAKVMVTVYRAKTVGGNYSRITELEAVELASASRAEVTQTRRFNYDNRGFLNSEQLPEAGASGNGVINYNEYDSLGRVGSRRDGARKLRYGYDAAGRLTLLRECLTEFAQCDVAGNSRPVKEYSFYSTDQSASGVYELGRLYQARRHNYLLNPYNNNAPADLVVTETYQYRKPGAAVSQRQLGTSTGLNFTQTFDYNDLGELTSQTYPQCSTGNCTGTAAARTVSYTRSNGELTGVPGFARSIQYHPNGMISRVEHLNSSGDNLVNDVYDKDPRNVQRPRQMTTQLASNSSTLWTTGVYRYDGVGNIKAIGSDWYVYDGAGRLTEGTSLGSANTAERRRQRYTYDPFGNILLREDFYHVGTPSETRTAARLETLSQSNRLNYIPYDSSGNIVGGPQTGNIYEYDATNKMTVAPEKIYIYTADDERVWTVNHAGPSADDIINTFTLRGLGNEVLREYVLYGHDTSAQRWAWVKDYVYAGRRLLSTVSLAGRLTHHPDHLGSTRLITNNAGQVYALHNYLPFGEEATHPSQDAERLKFTGHERDFNYEGGHTLDYMHARFYAAPQAKFLSLDPGRDFDPKQPQSWNLYAYVRNNPINLTDPTGKCAAPGGMKGGEIGICVEAFIAAWYLGAGDNRTFAMNDSKASSRMQHLVIVNPKTGEVRESKTFSPSRLGPKRVHGLTSIKGVGGMSLATVQHKDGSTGITVGGFGYSGYLGFPFAPTGDITYAFNFKVTPTGLISLLGGDHDAYPSHHVVVYNSEGKATEMWRFYETTPDKLKGPTDVKVPPKGPIRP